MKKRVVLILLCMLLVLSTTLTGCKSLGKMVGQKIRESREDEEYDEWDDYDDEDYDWDEYDDEDWDDYDDEDWDEYDDEDWDEYDDEDWYDDEYDEGDWDSYEEDDITLEDYFSDPANAAQVEALRQQTLSTFYDTYADVVYDFSGDDIYIEYYYLEKYEDIADDIAENLEAEDWTKKEEDVKQSFYTMTGIEPDCVYYYFYIDGTGDLIYCN